MHKHVYILIEGKNNVVWNKYYQLWSRPRLLNVVVSLTVVAKYALVFIISYFIPDKRMLS